MNWNPMSSAPRIQNQQQTGNTICYCVCNIFWLKSGKLHRLCNVCDTHFIPTVGGALFLATFFAAFVFKRRIHFSLSVSVTILFSTWLFHAALQLLLLEQCDGAPPEVLWHSNQFSIEGRQTKTQQNSTTTITNGRTRKKE